jgi:hypothetical protein
MLVMLSRILPILSSDDLNAFRSAFFRVRTDSPPPRADVSDLSFFFDRIGPPRASKMNCNYNNYYYDCSLSAIRLEERLIV